MYKVVVLGSAKSDVNEIFAWLFRRSMQGAQSWYDAFDLAIGRLETVADSCPRLNSPKYRGHDVRHLNFSSPHGRTYMLVFVVLPNEKIVQVIRVRAPGQRGVRRRDLK